MKAMCALAVVCVLGCSSAAGTSSSSLTAGAPSSARPVIGALQTSDRKVILLSAPEGLRVTVEDASGALIVRDVPVEALRDQDPLLYELCRSTVAQNGTYIDARLDKP